MAGTTTASVTTAQAEVYVPPLIDRLGTLSELTLKSPGGGLGDGIGGGPEPSIIF
jgi:hypothetical protein